MKNNYSQLLLFIKLHLKIIKNSIKFASIKELFRTMFILTAGTLFVIGSYIILYQVVIYISTLPVIGTLFLLRIVALALLISFIMLLFSSLIISMSTIFNSTDIEFLLSLPVKIKNLFLKKYVSTFLQSSWMVLILLVPFIISLSMVKNFYIYHIGIIFVSILLNMSISVSVGVIIAILISRLFPYKQTKDIVVIVIILLSVVGYTLFRFVEPEKLLNPDKFNELVQYLDFMSKPLGRWLPSWWSAEIVRGTVIKDYSLILKNFLVLLCVSGLFLFLTFNSAKKFFYKGLFPKDKLWFVKKRKELHMLSPEKALIKKDIKLFFREPLQWTQIVIVVALILVYIFSIQKLPIEIRYIKTTIALFNLGSVSFLTSALVLRFIFVQPSVEYKTLWILKSAPIKSFKIFILKLYTFLPWLILISTGIVILSNIALNTEKIMFVLSIFVIIISTVTLTVLGYMLGLLFPKPNYTSFAEIETSFGGLMFIILSLCYIIFTIGVLASPVRSYILKGTVELKKIFFHGFDFILINLLFTLPPLYYGYKKFITETG